MYRFITLFALLGCIVILSGCAALFSEQEWSENYSLLEGTQATSPQMIDGKLNTIGETTFPAGSQGFVGANPASQVVITLPEKKTIRRIVVHSDNLTEFDIFADKGSIAVDADWQLIKDVKSVKSSPIKISLLIPFPTDRIRLRVLGTKDDALLSRQERARSAGRGWNVGSRRAVGKIREIELYGYKTSEQVAVEEATDRREKELDDLLELE
ncbi:hypothetical protein F4Y59_05005 [Candidatus Poribacteria bacterium]|nr:hypothetical protein [Candidatus Poribacteria bacterium]MXY27506.1 hypothetical protein [Candidatus Poribacteria bacterium]MYK18830.1 hypothetical protein [Candidatus Poribacteria bacterium]